MVYLSGNHPKRTTSQKLLRYIIGVAACALIVFILWQLPYDILREERYRIYGETMTTGVVLEVHADGAEAEYPFVLRYKYIDAEGYAREANAPLPREIWEQYRPGTPLEVLYISSRPHISRVLNEIEPRFQLWLRDALN